MLMVFMCTYSAQLHIISARRSLLLFSASFSTRLGNVNFLKAGSCGTLGKGLHCNADILDVAHVLVQFCFVRGNSSNCSLEISN
jgi:hypothetical protein